MVHGFCFTVHTLKWHLCHIVEGFHSVLQQLLDIFWQQEPENRLFLSGLALQIEINKNIQIIGVTNIPICDTYSLIYLSIGTSMSSSICLSSKYSAAFLEKYT